MTLKSETKDIFFSLQKEFSLRLKYLAWVDGGRRGWKMKRNFFLIYFLSPPAPACVNAVRGIFSFNFDTSFILHPYCVKRKSVLLSRVTLRRHDTASWTTRSIREICRVIFTQICILPLTTSRRNMFQCDSCFLNHYCFPSTDSVTVAALDLRLHLSTDFNQKRIDEISRLQNCRSKLFKAMLMETMPELKQDFLLINFTHSNMFLKNVSPKG